MNGHYIHFSFAYTKISIINELVYSAGKNFTGRINPDFILPVNFAIDFAIKVY